MTRRSLRPCAYPGCPELVRYSRYCEKHQCKAQEQKAETNKHYNKHRRVSYIEKFYKSIAWRRLRDVVLARDHYLCQGCKRRKLITPANTVHHIVPIRQDWSRRLDPDNCESICSSCHNKKDHGGE